MKRRSFFKRLAGAASLLAVPSLFFQEEPTWTKVLKDGIWWDRQQYEAMQRLWGAEPLGDGDYTYFIPKP